MAPYFQDNIKVTPRLAVDWGLRWDLAFPFSNDNRVNRLVLFNPLVPNPGAIDPATGQPRLGAMALLGKGCDGCVGFDKLDMQWHHFSPRLGFTYQLNDKTVLLAGLSFSYLDTGAFEYGTNKVAVGYGNNLNGAINYSAQANQVPGFGQWDNTALPSPPQVPFTPDYFNTHFPNEMHKHVDQAYTELLTVGVQRELPWRMFASLSYVHTHDLHLPASLIRRTELNSKYLSMCTPGDTNLNDCVLGQSWTSGGPGSTPTPGSPQAVLQGLGFGQDSNGFYSPFENFINDYGAGTFLARALLPYAQFRGITNNFDTTGADKYNAVQMSLQKRTSEGLTFLVAYTMSKTLSNTDSGFSTFNFKGLDNLNPKAEWSVANDDRTHVLSLSGVYELPLGPGKKFLSGGGPVMKNVVGGWQLSGIFTYHTGTPIQIFSGANSINGTPLFYSGTNRANVLPGHFHVNWNGYYTGQAIINVDKFADPGAWTLGNAAPLYSSMRNPFESNEQLTLAKKFFLGERVSAELRMEYYNVLNRMRICSNLNNTVGTEGFGFFSGGGVPAGPSGVCQANSARQGQAFLKITF